MPRIKKTWRLYSPFAVLDLYCYWIDFESCVSHYYTSDMVPGLTLNCDLILLPHPGACDLQLLNNWSEKTYGEGRLESFKLGGSLESVVMIRCRSSYYKEQWMVVVAEKDLVNHGRTTSTNGQANRCRRCCVLLMIEVHGRSSQRMHPSEYPNDAYASSVVRVLLIN